MRFVNDVSKLGRFIKQNVKKQSNTVMPSVMYNHRPKGLLYT